MDAVKSNRPGDGLRDLAGRIEALVHEHAECSRASEAVSMLVDYLTLRARLSDYELCNPNHPLLEGGHEGHGGGSGAPDK